MTTLRQAVHEYLRMRRHLGFKLHEAGKGLLAFVRFMERHRARLITQALALTWAQQPTTRSTGALGSAPEFRARLCSVSQRDRSPHRDSASRLLPFQPEAGTALSVLGRRDSRALLRAALA